MAVKVNRQSKAFQGRPEINGRKNMFDLSHDVKTTFTMGKLVPILTMETLPGDEWFIRGEFMMRFAPLYLPIMHRVNMSVDYFYVPNRIMWPLTQNVSEGAEARGGWEVFINPGDNNLGFAQQVHPYVTVVPWDESVVTYELMQYMGFPTELVAGATASINVNAFFPTAYYMVYDQYYRNDQIQDRIFTQLVAGDNTGSMYGAGGPDLLSCKFRNWNRDYFTSATLTPQFGSDVQIPLVDTDFISPGGLPYGGPFRWRNQIDDGVPTGATAIQTNAGGVDGGRSTIAGGEVYLDIQETAGSIAQLRTALMLQEYLERALRAGDKYNDSIKAFWDEEPYKGVLQLPEFLGSKRGKVIVSEVMSTTETATLKVGNYAGQALSLESIDDTIKYHCKEHGVVLGIISVFPDSSYMQGIDRKWTRELPTDYAWEQFALIGDQEIKNKEVNYDPAAIPVDPDYNDAVFGYIPRYSEYRYHNDIYSGLMRTTFISFHLGRVLSTTAPETTVLDDDFLQCRPDVTRVFQIAEGEDEIYAHIYNDIKVLRRLPKFGIPAV